MFRLDHVTAQILNFVDITCLIVSLIANRKKELLEFDALPTQELETVAL